MDRYTFIVIAQLKHAFQFFSTKLSKLFLKHVAARVFLTNILQPKTGTVQSKEDDFPPAWLHIT